MLEKMMQGRWFIGKTTWWWTEEVQVAIKAKKMAYKAWFQTCLATVLQQYKGLSSVVKLAVEKKLRQNTTMTFMTNWIHRKGQTRSTTLLASTTSRPKQLAGWCMLRMQTISYFKTHQPSDNDGVTISRRFPMKSSHIHQFSALSPFLDLSHQSV